MPFGEVWGLSVPTILLARGAKKLRESPPVALPARFLKKSATVSTTPTFSPTPD
jgi:hypothetical protein